MADNDIDPSIELEPAAAKTASSGNRSNAAKDVPTLSKSLGGGNSSGARSTYNNATGEALGDASAENADDDTAEFGPEDCGDGPDGLNAENWDGDGSESELVDYEEDGKHYKIPAALKGHLLRQADYSRNMNSLKQEQKKIEAAREETTRSRAIEEAQKQTLGKLANIDRELKHFVKGADGKMVAANDIDWATWQKSDPQQAKAALTRFNALSRQRSSLARDALGGRQKYETEAKLRTAERLRATRDFAQKELPNWSPDRDREITHFAVKELGFTERDIIQSMSPKMYRLADLALDGHRYREARAKQSKSGTTSNVTPLTTIAKQRSGSTGAGLSDKLSTDEWVRRRNKQVQRNIG